MAQETEPRHPNAPASAVSSWNTITAFGLSAFVAPVPLPAAYRSEPSLTRIGAVFAS